MSVPMLETLHIADSLCTIDPHGGKVAELVIHGVRILGTFDRIDGKKGATHVCVPNFAAEGMTTYGLPFHGPARNQLWSVDAASSVSMTLSTTLAATKEYPSSLRVTQHCVLTADRFTHTVYVTNAGSATVPVNIGIHDYFATPHGWRGTRLNDQDVTEHISQNQSLRSHPTRTIIQFPGAHPIAITGHGFSDFMLWSAKKNGVYDDAYACVEPVFSTASEFFGSEVSLLHPDATRSISQEITLA